MNRSLRTGVAALVVALGMALGLAAPASAVGVKAGASTCAVTVSRTATSVAATNNTCSSVQASIKYYQGASTIAYVNTGARGSSSSAKSPTLTVVGRYVKVWISSSTGTVTV